VRDIINWLVEFENTAARFYGKAAIYFGDDEKLANMARRLAEDEVWHANIIKKASEHLQGKEPPPSLIRLDIESKKDIEGLLNECEERFTSGNVTKREFLEYIVKAEYSEWNTYLLYIVNSIKDLPAEFMSVPKKMQEHKGRIEDYIKELSDGPEAVALLEKIGRLPDLWKERFLLAVDDEEMIIELLKAILEAKGTIDCAHNGKEALEKHKNKYYDVIITDVDMPVMGGIEFYEQASKDCPNIKERIIFFTGRLNEERLAFFKKNSLRYLQKPARINEIINAINDVLKDT
jgi:CheY-like chemotaxis protein/ferritin-like protein